jgi:hypothetical protein
MRSRFKTLAAVAASLMLLPLVAAAGESDVDLQKMQDMMLQMQDQLAEQQRVLDAQAETIEEAGLDERGAASGIAGFFQSVDFGGHISTSYTYSAVNNGPGNDNIRGQTGYQTGGTDIAGAFDAGHYQNDSQAFALDQLWFTADKPATPESRAGFHFDIAYGKTAWIHNGRGGGDASFGAGNDQVELFSAYISYLAPVGSGLRLDAGELWTTVGAEVVNDTQNWNITRSLVWQMQPVNYTGVHAAYEVGGITFLAGFANDVWQDVSVDTDNNKAVVGQIAWSNDALSVAGNVVYGSENETGATGNEGDKRGLANMVVTWDINDAFSTWLDYNYGWTNNVAHDYNYAHGVALAARWSFNDGKSGVSLRGEYVTAWQNDGAAGGQTGDTKAYEVTLTADHMLTNDLMLRGEARWDQGKPDGAFHDNQGDPPHFNDSVLLLAQLVYTF